MTAADRPTRTDRTAARVVLAAAAAGAGLIHLAVAPAHLEAYRPMGVAFLVSGTLQLLWAVAIVRRDSARLLRLGAAGWLLFIGGYLLSRTIGLPVGPEAFEPEPLGSADLVCCGLELLTATGALALAASGRLLRRPLRAGAAALTAALLLAVGGTTGVALASPGEHAHAEEHACPPDPVLTGVRDARGVDTGVTAYFSCKLRHEHEGHTP